MPFSQGLIKTDPKAKMWKYAYSHSRCLALESFTLKLEDNEWDR